MRKFLYFSLMDKIMSFRNEEGCSIIKTVDLWNEQVEFIEQEAPFDTPAIFIEFLPINWNSLSSKIQQATFNIRLHIVSRYEGDSRNTSMFQTQAMNRFDLLDQLDELLNNFADEDAKCGFCMFHRIGSSTNHNHEELIEDITEYSTLITQHL